MNKTKKHSIKKEIDYYSLRIMSCLRSPQGTVEETTEHPESVMSMIRRQGRKQSLTHVSDMVLHFFEMMYVEMAKYFTTDLLKVVGDRILSDCIDSLHSNETLISEWFKLFQDVPEICQCNLSLLSEEKNMSSDDEDCEEDSGDDVELQYSIILDLYKKISVFMCRVVFADIRGQYVDTKRKKKLALRMKLRAENNCDEVKKSKVPYPCAVCEKECKSFFTTFAEQSVQCSNCKIWLHFPCAALSGKEVELQEGHEDDEWLCRSCKQMQNFDDLLQGQEDVNRGTPDTTRPNTCNCAKTCKGKCSSKNNKSSKRKTSQSASKEKEHMKRTKLNPSEEQSHVQSTVQSISSRGRIRKAKGIIDV